MAVHHEKPAIRMFRVLKHYPSYSRLLDEKFLTRETASFCAEGIAIADHLPCSILETIEIIEWRKERDTSKQHQTSLRLSAGAQQNADSEKA